MQEGSPISAAHSIVIQILANGKSYERSLKLSEVISKVGATVLSVEEAVFAALPLSD